MFSKLKLERTSNAHQYAQRPVSSERQSARFGFEDSTLCDDFESLSDLDPAATDQPSPVLRRPSTPVTAELDADSKYTHVSAPRLVEREAEDTQLAETTATRSASSALSIIDLVDDEEPLPLSEFRARHIARVAEQRARRRRNPPPRNRTVYTCRLCARSFTSRRQLSFHEASGRHERELNRLHDLAANLHCQLCDLPFADRHNFQLHNRSRIHFRNARRKQEARLN